jgi:hypothetical protein
MELIITYYHSTSDARIAHPKLRVQRKDKAGSQGTFLELHDLKHGESVKMQAAANNRIKVWMIGEDERQYPATQHYKFTIPDFQVQEMKILALLVKGVDSVRAPWLEFDHLRSVKKS